MLSERVARSDEHGLYKTYINDVEKYPLLTKSEERQLLKEVKNGNKKAFDRLICSNLRFVIKVAFMYRGRGLPVLDLINEGNIGLMEAAKRFNPDQKVKFTSYAVWWIRQAITQALFEKARMVRLSAANELKIMRIGKHSPRTRQMAGGGGQRIDSEHLANRMGFKKSHMEDLLKMKQHHLSLDAPAYSDSKTSIADKLICRNFDHPDKEATEKSLNKFLANSMLHLTPKERKILTFFFGLDGTKQMTFNELGEIFGLCKERVRQIKEEALDKLRDIKMPRDHLLAA